MGWLNTFLDGKKTLIAGIAGLLTTIGAFLTSLGDGFQFSDLQTLGVGLVASLGLLGLGGKLQKLLDVVKK